MDKFHRLESEKNFTAGAKSVSALFVAGLVALLVGHTMMAPTDDPGAVAAVAVPAIPATPGVGTDTPAGYLPAMTRAPADAGAAARDEPPIATF